MTVIINQREEEDYKPWVMAEYKQRFEAMVSSQMLKPILQLHK